MFSSRLQSIFHCQLRVLLIPLQGSTGEILTSSFHSQAHNLGHLRCTIHLSAHSPWDPQNDRCTQEHKEEVVHFWTRFKPQVTLNFLESGTENTTRLLLPHWTLTVTSGKPSSYYSHFCKEFQQTTKFHASWVFSWLASVQARLLLDEVDHTLGNMESLKSVLHLPDHQPQVSPLSKSLLQRYRWSSKNNH